MTVSIILIIIIINLSSFWCALIIWPHIFQVICWGTVLIQVNILLRKMPPAETTHHLWYIFHTPPLGIGNLCNGKRPRYWSLTTIEIFLKTFRNWLCTTTLPCSIQSFLFEKNSCYEWMVTCNFSLRKIQLPTFHIYRKVHTVLASKSSSSLLKLKTTSKWRNTFKKHKRYVNIQFGVPNLVGARFSTPAQTSLGAHPFSCTMFTGSLS